MTGHIRKRGERSWAILLDLPRGPDGKRRRKWHTVHGTKKDAQRKRNELLHQLETGAYCEPAKMTVNDYLQKWLKDYASTNVSGKTFERYAEIVRNHLEPAIGNLPLPRLQPLHVQECYSELLKSGRKDGKGGLSKRTVLHAHRLLHTALGHAVKWQLVARNVADAVQPPTPERKEMKALDERQTVWLFEAAQGTRLYVPILFDATTGVRRGELLAVKWPDLNLDAGNLSLRRSLEQTRKGLRFKETKNKKGRAISLPAILVKALHGHLAEQNEYKRLFGDDYNDQGLVFARPDGSIWKPESFTEEYFRFTRKIGVRVRFHDLRHSHASQLLRAGVPIKVVSERLGHSSVQITLDTYSHVLPGMQEEAAEKIDVALKTAMRDSQQGGLGLVPIQSNSC